MLGTLRKISRVLVVLAAAGLSACATASQNPWGSGAASGAAPHRTGAGKPKLVQLAEPVSCVPYARDRSGIDIHGDAVDWWALAHGRYAEGAQPTTGSVMVLTGYAGPNHGHLAVVTQVVSAREIRVDHANWLNHGNLYLNSPVVDVSPDNDWSEVKVWNTRDGHMGGNAYHVRGFIAPYSVATN